MVNNTNIIIPIILEREEIADVILSLFYDKGIEYPHL